jgi:hypothetical protein
MGGKENESKFTSISAYCAIISNAEVGIARSTICHMLCVLCVLYGEKLVVILWLVTRTRTESGGGAAAAGHGGGRGGDGVCGEGGEGG